MSTMRSIPFRGCPSVALSSLKAVIEGRSFPAHANAAAAACAAAGEAPSDDEELIRGNIAP